MSKDIELKPCPFCGGDAIASGYSSYGSTAWVAPYALEQPKSNHLCKIKCSLCNVSQPESYGSTPELVFKSSQTKWNTRAPIKGEG